MKGVYALIVNVSEFISLQVGSLGEIEFAPGTWVYIGSAMGSTSTSLENRLKRHFSEEKTKHWHIDYLLDTSVKPVEVVYATTDESMECELATTMRKSRNFEIGPSGFGASDCRADCGSHIFRLIENVDISKVVLKLFHSLGLDPERKC